MGVLCPQVIWSRLRPKTAATLSRSDGLGVHRIWWDGGRYAYASARERGFDARILIVVDLADPARPRLASRWWWPGQRDGDRERLPEGHDIGAHHVIARGDRAYGGYFDAGVVVYAVRPDGSLHLVSSLSWARGGHPHTHFLFWPMYGWHTSRVPAPYRSAPALPVSQGAAFKPALRPTMFSSRTLGGGGGVGKQKPSGFGRVSVRTSKSGGHITGMRTGRSGSFGRAGGGGSS